MRHLSDEELMACSGEEPPQEASTAKHLQECAHCIAELQKLEAFLASLQAPEVPEPGEDYERRMWQRIAPRLPEKTVRWWQVWMQPRGWEMGAAVAVLLMVGFFAGRVTKQPAADAGEPDMAQVRERVLLMAVGQHLGRSEAILMELANADPAGAGPRLMNASAEQRRAENLLEENRLYRSTAQQSGDEALASILGELERVLQDIARSPQEVTPAQFGTIQKRIEAGGVLFKVRVIGRKLRQQPMDVSSATRGTV